MIQNNISSKDILHWILNNCTVSGHVDGSFSLRLAKQQLVGYFRLKDLFQKSVYIISLSCNICHQSCIINDLSYIDLDSIDSQFIDHIIQHLLSSS